jgi:hypothetical protein
MLGISPAAIKTIIPKPNRASPMKNGGKPQYAKPFPKNEYPKRPIPITYKNTRNTVSLDERNMGAKKNNTAITTATMGYKIIPNAKAIEIMAIEKPWYEFDVTIVFYLAIFS